jgi:hypothetical protein
MGKLTINLSKHKKVFNKIEISALNTFFFNKTSELPSDYILIHSSSIKFEAFREKKLLE